MQTHIYAMPARRQRELRSRQGGLSKPPLDSTRPEVLPLDSAGAVDFVPPDEEIYAAPDPGLGLIRDRFAISLERREWVLFNDMSCQVYYVTR